MRRKGKGRIGVAPRVKEVRFRKGTHIPKAVNAVKAAAALTRIYQRDGTLSTTKIVEEGRSPRSPLHAAFEWDDTKASHEYRLIQARHLVASIEITYTRPDGAEVPARRYLNLGVDRQAHGHKEAKGYVELERAMDDEELRQQQLLAALSEIERVVNKWACFPEFNTIAQAVARVRGRVGVEGKAA